MNLVNNLDWFNARDGNAFVQRAKLFADTGYINEYRIFELYKSLDTFSPHDWPCLAACVLSSDDSFVRKVSIDLIGRIDPYFSVAILPYLYYQTEDETERGLILLSLGLSKDKGIVGFLIGIYQTENSWKIKDNICQSLGIIGSELAAPFLYQIIISEKSLSIKETAIWALEQIPGIISSKFLSRIVLDSKINISLRVAAFEKLASRDFEMAKKDYLGLTKDSELEKIVSTKFVDLVDCI